MERFSCEEEYNDYMARIADEDEDQAIAESESAAAEAEALDGQAWEILYRCPKCKAEYNYMPDYRNCIVCQTYLWEVNNV